MKILFYLISIILMTIGFKFMIIYINLFSFGYSISEYILFIISRVEVDLFFIGFIIQLFLRIKRR